jgi:type I restriction enzyme, R subunit
MRVALPNGTFFAFTGTPIDKKEKSTYRVFGPLLDRYSFDESKADGATLAIKYEGRMTELFVEGEGETIEQVFDRVFSDQTKDVKDKLKKQYVTKEKILEAPSRIKKVCLDVIDHFANNVKPNGLKAMLVASSRQAAVTYKKVLDNLNGPISKVIMTSKLGEKGSDGESWDRCYLLDYHNIVYIFLKILLLLLRKSKLNYIFSRYQKAHRFYQSSLNHRYFCPLPNQILVVVQIKEI